MATIPAARLSDRIGRKRVIYWSYALAAVGVIGVSISPILPLTLLSLVPLGISAGMFLVVDWALMTDIIPKARAGRYMGISNVATASAGPLGLAVAGVVLFLVTRAGLPFEGAPDISSGLLGDRAAGGDRVHAAASGDRRAHPQGSGETRRED